jgi:hypothetical protein
MSRWPALTVSRLTHQPPARRTSRRPKTARVPRTRAGGEWSEAQFWSYLRSGLRQLSRRWPPIVRGVWLAGRRPYVGSNKRQRWEYQCEVCSGWFIRSDMEANHLHPCGSLRSWEEFATFAERLFVEVDGLRRECQRCHAETHASRNGGTP